MTQQVKILDELRKLSINNDVEEMRKFAQQAAFIAGRMALAGQITVFYAGPNTGKTLITLKLIAEAIANGTAGNHVYHLNLDDTYEGLIMKADLGNRHGFQVISPSNFPHPNDNFSEVVDHLISERVADQTVFIMDTIKKFVDVMDKKASSEFMTTCRKLTSEGGSIIALAHTNKHRGSDEASVPAGTSDVLDDCDCAYVIDILNEEKVPEGLRRTVEFQNKKSRGPSVQSASYTYIKNKEADYFRMFNTVKLLDGEESDKVRAQKALESERCQDAELISEISSILKTSGESLQKDLVSAVISSGKFPRRKVVECLHRWACAAGEGGVWEQYNGPRNSKKFKLLP